MPLGGSDKLSLNKKSLTMVEMMIIVMIIGILAFIAMPAVKDWVRKAKKLEAYAALRAIRDAERLYYLANRQDGYIAPLGAGYSMRASQFANLRLNITNFDGTYFSNQCYYVVASSTVCWIYCAPSISMNPPSPRANEIKNFGSISMNAINGVIIEWNGGGWETF